MALSPTSSHGGGTFDGGTITDRLTIAPATDTEPLIVTGKSGGTSGLVEVDSHTGADVFDINNVGAVLISPDSALSTALTIQGKGGDATATAIFDVVNTTGSAEMRFSGPSGLQLYSSPIQAGGADLNPIASGALPTVAPVTATAFQCSTTRDVFLTVPVTYNPGVATTATCKVELSPDNVTFSELVTITQPVGTVFDGTVEAVQLFVPAGWRVKLTVTNATLGTGTYY